MNCAGAYVRHRTEATACMYAIAQKKRAVMTTIAVTSKPATTAHRTAIDAGANAIDRSIN